MTHYAVEPFEAIILAGGASRRLGYPKALLDWNGIPLWKHIVREVASVAEKVAIVGFPEQFTTTDLAIARFIDDPTRVGPLGGLAIGLRQISTAKVFVMACDMPFVRRDAIIDLMQNAKNADVIMPRTSDGVHPLFAVYSRDCLSAVEAALARNERRMRSFHSGLHVRELEITDDNPTWKNVLTNINTPAELSEVIGDRTCTQLKTLALNPFS